MYNALKTTSINRFLCFKVLQKALKKTVKKKVKKEICICANPVKNKSIKF
ncbi:hypothetical protein KL86DYS2_12707 [uncultured Dysgonomonas sp.]|uniref:Uncharacterized protein n=1 Tax=uncultured Dysgonomonas sp. TaxID=206096 RepID=A0A212JZT6_9BACT|nr:hypothetical protein KL86DYS2_12707 [uncultured Dysgonomonas sp.]